MGFGDPHCFNPGSKAPTPHMDRLARRAAVYRRPLTLLGLLAHALRALDRPVRLADPAEARRAPTHGIPT